MEGADGQGSFVAEGKLVELCLIDNKIAPEKDAPGVDLETQLVTIAGEGKKMREVEMMEQALDMRKINGFLNLSHHYLAHPVEDGEVVTMIHSSQNLLT